MAGLDMNILKMAGKKCQEKENCHKHLFRVTMFMAYGC